MAVVLIRLHGKPCYAKTKILKKVSNFILVVRFTRNDGLVVLMSSFCKDGYAYTHSNPMLKSVFTMMFARSLFGFHLLLYFSSHFLKDTEEAQRSIDGQRMFSVSISDWTHRSFLPPSCVVASYVSNANAERCVSFTKLVRSSDNTLRYFIQVS
jgi:hypothetical protein